MEYIRMIGESIKSILNNISNDPTEINVLFDLMGLILTGIGTMVTVLLMIGGTIRFIDSKIVARSGKPKNVAKRTLKKYNEFILSSLKNESVFFNEDDPKKLLFYKKVPIKALTSGEKTNLNKLRLSSYILLGEAGSGKSSIVKKDYIFNSNKFFEFWRMNTGIVFINHQFFGQKIEDISSLDKLIDCVQQTKYKKIILYIDGLDEFGENKINDIYASLIKISPKLKKIKLTSRTNFAMQNVFNKSGNQKPFWFKEKQRYIVGKWQRDDLIKLADLLLKNMTNKDADNSTLIQKIQCNISSWENHIDSPLLMKLYVYILAFGNKSSNIAFDNKYSFYSQFVSEVISTYRKRQGNFNVAKIGEELDKISKDIFKSFSDDSKQVKRTSGISAILKPTNSGTSIFVHETFFEYFVARYYLIQLSKETIDTDILNIFHQTYTNDFADFITSGLNSSTETTLKKIVETLFNIYYCTFDSKAARRALDIFGSIRKKSDFLSRFKLNVQQLPEYDFFTLKYEIIFRLGRISNSFKEIADFLEFVYCNDSHIKIKEDVEYYIAVLRRCCAISCSFLGAENIELDYVKKMLPCNAFGVNQQYLPNYDLANRSHTLLFYGDVTNTSIFDFKDDATNNPFARAFSKRINRLKDNLPTNVYKMNQKQKKKYYFRVFDLATIYTFMFNRQKCLTDEDLEIVNSTKVYFVGASSERNEIMRELQALIINLNNELKP